MEGSPAFGHTVFGDTVFGDTVFGDTVFGDTAFGDTALGHAALGHSALRATAPGKPVASLPVAAARGRPVAGAESKLMDVPAPLVPLFPEGGIRRGSTVSVGPMVGGGSVALALAGAVTGGGGWAAAVGWPSLGLAAAVELGADLRRLALVPAPGEHWAAVVAALLDGFDLVMLRPPARVRVGDARRLAARIRERGSVMMIIDGPRWPESTDITLTAGRAVWDGLGEGHGCLTGRRLEVVAGGRRSGGRERRRTVWLPAPRPLLGTAGLRSGPAIAAVEDGPVDLPTRRPFPAAGAGPAGGAVAG